MSVSIKSVRYLTTLSSFPLSDEDITPAFSEVADLNTICTGSSTPVCGLLVTKFNITELELYVLSDIAWTIEEIFPNLFFSIAVINPAVDEVAASNTKYLDVTFLDIGSYIGNIICRSCPVYSLVVSPV